MESRRLRRLAAVVVAALAGSGSGFGPVPQPALTTLSRGLVLERSVTIKPGIYRLQSADLTTPAVIIRGSGVTVDFSGAILEGTPQGDNPDTFSGLGVLIDGGSKAARVWVDGEEVIDAWSPHESRVDRAAIMGGRKKFKVEYYETGGFAELRFDIQRR
jgi:hypothetical protein